MRNGKGYANVVVGKVNWKGGITKRDGRDFMVIDWWEGGEIEQ
jgi:hypothetical protein